MCSRPLGFQSKEITLAPISGNTFTESWSLSMARQPKSARRVSTSVAVISTSWLVGLVTYFEYSKLKWEALLWLYFIKSDPTWPLNFKGLTTYQCQHPALTFIHTTLSRDS